ncbi:MAG: sugar transferase, partial [Clostridia bacterium]|nr:sugar transferase [Clostridia bacterium]
MFKFIKRFGDIFLSLIGLIICIIPMIIIAIAIKLDSKGPVIFKQKRLGMGGKEFYIYKFRTMVNDAEKGGV